MCGIVGIVRRGGRIDPRQLEAMSGAIRHRGPDDDGLWIADDGAQAVGFASRRLSILDLSPAGHMPMANPAGDVTLAYNGEIYNHLELRRGLEAAGYAYRSRTDTETLLHLYEEHGLDCFAKLNGMFAAAIHDRRRQRVVLARDRMGIKPLYYAIRDGRLLFASELKALLALPELSREIDPAALRLYLALGYVPAPHSLLREVRRLPAGCMLVFEGGAARVEPFWSGGYRPEKGGAAAPASGFPDDARLAAETRRVIEEAVKSQLMSDVPVGVLLSGGIDSTIVTAVAQRHHGQPLNTFAIGFEQRDAPVDDAYNLDRRYAALAAERIGTAHHEIIVDDAFDLEGMLRQLTQALDEPVWELSFVSIFLLCQLARQHGVKVVLTGDGSDELFAGYSWYRGLRRLQAYERVPLLGAALPLLSSLFRGRDLGAKADDLRRKLRAGPLDRYRTIYGKFAPDEISQLLGAAAPDPLDGLIAPILGQAGGGLLEQFAFADLRLWVGEHFNHRLDRMSMAASVEARVPFQDDTVVDLALGLSVRRKLRGPEQKYLLRQAFADLIPQEILARAKRPFAAPQYGWLRGRLRPFADQLLSEERVRAAGVLDPAGVRAVYERCAAGGELDSHKISILMMLQLWCEEVLHGAGAPAAAAGRG